MFEKPQEQHQWLEQLAGQWSFEHEYQMPDGSTSKTPGTMNCRSLGGLWMICESSYQTSEGSWSSIMTLGFDPTQEQYVGTFIGSMMTKIWLYHGVLDETGKRLPLESEGPKFVGTGGHYGAIALGVDTEGNVFGLHNPPANVDGCT